MYKIEDLIKYYHESEFLDFKQQEYKDAVKPNLIKDVLAFANAANTGDKYIIIGIKKDLNGIVVHDIENPFDSANIQQYVSANIAPSLDIQYVPFRYEGKNLMVLTVKNPQNQPYLIKKTIMQKEKTFLKEGEMWIRKGSFQLPVSREDLDEMYKRKHEKDGLEGKIRITFEDGTTNFRIICARDIVLPSDQEQAALEESIHNKNALLENGHEELDDANIRLLQNGGKINLNDISSIENLENRVKDVKMNFKDEDSYYLYEQRSSRINFILTNNGMANLEDALLELRIPVLEGFTIADHIYKNTASLSILAGIFDADPPYPKVSVANGVITVREEFSNVRHKIPVKSFKEPLRVFSDSKLAGQQLKFTAIVHGKNLKIPQEFDLVFTFS